MLTNFVHVWEKFLITLKKCLDTWIAVLTLVPENLAKSPKVNRWVRKYLKLLISFKKLFFLKKFLWKRKCSFDNLAHTFSPKTWNFSLKIRNRFEHFFFKKDVCWKCSYGHVEWSFDNHAKKFSPKFQKISAQSLKIFMEKNLYSRMKCVSSRSFSGHVECSSDNPVEVFLGFFMKKSRVLWNKPDLF